MILMSVAEEEMITQTKGGASGLEVENTLGRQGEATPGIAYNDQGLLIDLRKPLSEIGESDFIYQHYRALAQAVTLMLALKAKSGTTVGIHLNHWLHRNPYGRTTEPSDLMAALLSLNASLQLSGPAGEQTLSLDSLIAESERNDSCLRSIGQDEELANIHLPQQMPEEQSIYLKALNSKVWAFAQVGVAVWLRMENTSVAEMRLVANGITPTLWRLRNAEQVLIGQPLEEIWISRAVETLLAESMPSEQNRYKVPLVKGLLHRALNHLAQEA